MILRDLASLAGGTLIGDGSLEVKGFSTIEDAQPGDLVFVLDDKNLADALNSKASALVISDKANVKNRPAIRVSNPRLALSRILKHYSKKSEITPGIHKSAVIAKTAVVGKGAAIGPFAYIGPNSKVGEDSIIYPHVAIYGNVRIGKRCVIHSGTRIGIDGYGFVPTDRGLEKIPQVGGVLIGDDVELFSNVCISRGTLGDTVIGSGTKIDNLTHIAHNCQIGENCAITGLVGFAGSVTLKDNVSVGGQAGFSGHLTIGENTVIMARSGVTKDIPANSTVSGFPAQDHKKELEIQALLRRLKEIAKK